MSLVFLVTVQEFSPLPRMFLNLSIVFSNFPALWRGIKMHITKRKTPARIEQTAMILVSLVSASELSFVDGWVSALVLAVVDGWVSALVLAVLEVTLAIPVVSIPAILVVSGSACCQNAKESSDCTCVKKRLIEIQDEHQQKWATRRHSPSFIHCTTQTVTKLFGFQLQTRRAKFNRNDRM